MKRNVEGSFLAQVSEALRADVEQQHTAAVKAWLKTLPTERLEAVARGCAGLDSLGPFPPDVAAARAWWAAQPTHPVPEFAGLTSEELDALFEAELHRLGIDGSVDTFGRGQLECA